MSDTDPDIEVLETDLRRPPAAAPPRFRELVALALKTTNTTVLDAAEQDYRGVFDSVDHFIHNQLGEHLPRHLQWLPACWRPREAATRLRARARPTMDDRPTERTGDRLRVAARTYLPVGLKGDARRFLCGACRPRRLWLRPRAVQRGQVAGARRLLRRGARPRSST